MYRDIQYKSSNQRSSLASQYGKRWSSTARAFTRIKKIQENEKLVLKQNPLWISATSWIIVTPNAFNSSAHNFNVNMKREKPIEYKNSI